MARRIYTKQFNESYKAYRKAYFKKVRQFEKLNRKAERQGSIKRYLMRSDVLKKADYYAARKAFKRELADEGIKNPNINQYIVSDQAYSYSRKQFRGLKSRQDELKSEVGLDISGIKEIDFRTGNYEIDWDNLRNEYWRLRDEYNMSPEAARKEISSLYFGSN